MNALAHMLARAQSATPAEHVGIIREQIAILGRHTLAALLDGVATDLRKAGFDDRTADHLNDAADAIRAELREPAEKPLGRESASWRGEVA